MKKYLLCLMFFIFIASCKSEGDNLGGEQDQMIRKPVFAGKFYASDSAVLLRQIEIFLENAVPKKVYDIAGLIVPHAGYIYSGQIAADAFNQVRNNNYELVVILGTNHTTAGFSGISVFPKGKFATPIGTLEIDTEAAEKLLQADSDVNTNLDVHEKEHSIEVQIPFIKYLFPKAKILPIIVGEPNLEMCSKFGKALAGIIKDKKSLVVASSDLSHYPSFDDAVKVDYKTLKAIVSMDPEQIVSTMHTQLYQHLPNLVTCGCGEAPLIASIFTAKELGAKGAVIISSSNSGYNPIGNIDRVVGYGAAVITKNFNVPESDFDELVVDRSYKLTQEDKQVLLKFARKTLDQYFKAEIVPLPRNENRMLKLKRGAFVTLKKMAN